MKNYAAQTGGSISDWHTQAGFALNELRSRPEGLAAANATTPEQVALAQMHYEAPQGFTANDPTAGHNYTGRLNTIRKFTALDPNATGAFAPSANPQVAPQAGAPASSVGPSTVAGAAPTVGGVGTMAANPFGQVGNPQLNAALAQIMAQSRFLRTRGAEASRVPIARRRRKPYPPGPYVGAELPPRGCVRVSWCRRCHVDPRARRRRGCLRPCRRLLAFPPILTRPPHARTAPGRSWWQRVDGGDAADRRRCGRAAVLAGRAVRSVLTRVTPPARIPRPAAGR